MAKKRSVGVEETENKARAKIQTALLLPEGPVRFYARIHEDLRKGAIAEARKMGLLDKLFSRTLFLRTNERLHSWTKGDAKIWRDRTISRAVRRGVEAGLKATRGRHQRYTNGAHSACSLVAEELKVAGFHMTEDAVEKIWRASEKTKLVLSDGK